MREPNLLVVNVPGFLPLPARHTHLHSPRLAPSSLSPGKQEDPCPSDGLVLAKKPCLPSDLFLIISRCLMCT